MGSNWSANTVVVSAPVGAADDWRPAMRKALKERPRAWAPLDWAETQNNLGHAIQILRERGRAF